MALNNLGLGFVFTAKDDTGAAFAGVNRGLVGIGESAEAATGKMNGLRDAGGRFVKGGSGGGGGGGGLAEGFSYTADQIANSFAKVGTVVAGIGAAMSYALHLATEEAQKFNAGIAEVSTLVDEAQFHVADMTRITQEMAAVYGGDLQTQIKGLYQGISAGAADATSATNLLNAANKLAIGGVTDTRTAVDGLTNVLNSYALSYDHATEVSDAFFVALKSGKTTAAELAATVGQLAPTAGAVGVGFQQMLGAISAVTTKGLNTAAAVTGLKAALANVIKPTSDAAAEAARLGIKFDAATLRAKGLPAFLDQITGAAKFNKDSMAKLFGSIEGLNAIMALTAGDSATFKSVLDSMASSAGQTDAAFDKMSDTAEFQQKRLDALKQSAMVLVGQALLPMQKIWLQVSNAILTAFTKLPAPLRNGIVVVAAFVAGFAVLTGGIIAAVGAFMLLDTAIVPALIAIGALASLMIGLVPPILIIGVAIYGLKRAFDENLGGITTKLREFYDRMMLVWNGLEQVFTDGGFSGSVREELDKAQNAGLKQFIIEIFTFAKRVEEFFNGIQRGFGGAIDKMGPIFSALGDAFTKLGTAFAHLFGGENDPGKKAEAFKSFGKAGESVGDVLAKIVDIAATGLTQAVNAIGSFVTALGTFRPVFQVAFDSVQQLFGAFGELVGAFTGGNSSVQSTNLTLESFARTVAGGIAQVAGLVAIMATFVRASLLPVIGYVNLLRGTWTLMKNTAISNFQDIVLEMTKMAMGAAKIADGLAAAFGKNLGAQAAIGGIAAKTAAFGEGGLVKTHKSAALGEAKSVSNTLVSAASAGSSGGAPDQASLAAAAAAAAAAANSVTKEPLPPINLFLDSEKISEAVVAKQNGGGARAFQPQGPPQ